LTCKRTTQNICRRNNAASNLHISRHRRWNMALFETFFSFPWVLSFYKVCKHLFFSPPAIFTVGGTENNTPTFMLYNFVVSRVTVNVNWNKMMAIGCEILIKFSDIQYCKWNSSCNQTNRSKRMADKHLRWRYDLHSAINLYICSARFRHTSNEQRTLVYPSDMIIYCLTSRRSSFVSRCLTDGRNMLEVTEHPVDERYIGDSDSTTGLRCSSPVAWIQASDAM
jgi:hypothetical protein